MFAEITVLSLFLLLLLYKYLTVNFDYWKQRNVTFEPPKIFFGTKSDLYLGRLNLGDVAQKIYMKYPDERFVGTFYTRYPELTVRDPEVIKHVMTKDFDHFRDRILHHDDSHEFLLGNIVWASGEKWDFLRKKLTSTFSSGKIRNMLPLMLDCGGRFGEHLKDQVNSADEFELQDLTAKYTVDFIGACIFGVDMNTINEHHSVYLSMAHKIFESSLWRNLRLFMIQLCPNVRLLGLRVFRRDLETFILNFVSRVLRERNWQISNRNDFIDLLIHLKQEANKDANTTLSFDFDEKLIAAQALAFFGAGFETSSSAISFALYELAKNQSLQDRVFNEITEILELNNNSITYEALHEMTYLDQVLHEALRKYPPFNIVNRVCVKKYVIPGSAVELLPNCNVCIPIYALHHDPKYYPDPELFDPERFSKVNISKRPSHTYLAFGEGPRNCIGARFGQVQTKIGLITILKDFKVETCSRTEEKIIFEPKSLTTKSRNGIWVKLNKRFK